MQAISTTDFPNLKLFRRGKVRDVYDLGDTILFVATDRLSAFDVIIPDPIPLKGRVLTALSEFWFEKLEGTAKHHLITTNVDEYPAECAPYKEILRGRSMLVKKTAPLPLECIVRGYLTGSGLKDYNRTGEVCGIPLPAGLVDGSELPEVLFTPSTKAEQGFHDENISFDEAVGLVGKAVAEKVRDMSIAVYSFARNYARERGIIIADTKFEFGLLDGEVILIDEVLTPDSSRFWPVSEYQPGQPQPSFDKQYVRDYLASTGWEKTPPAPHLPEEVIEKTTQKYLESYKMIAGKDLQI